MTRREVEWEGEARRKEGGKKGIEEEEDGRSKTPASKHFARGPIFPSSSPLYWPPSSYSCTPTGSSNQ